MPTATFRPQAWIRDTAVEVDAPGPTCWRVSDAYLALLVEQHGMAKLMQASYEADELRHDPAAPEWIREWQGPFDVSLDTREVSGHWRNLGPGRSVWVNPYVKVER